MDPSIAPPELFPHVRIIIGMVLGLGISRLVTGLARFVQHPKKDAIYPVHLGWVLFVLLAIIHFWWYQFRLSTIGVWTFEIYVFEITYAIVFAFLCGLLFPDHMAEYSGFKSYFQSRRKWFYGCLSLIFVIDPIDTLIKGTQHFHSLGIEYPIRQAVMATLSIAAIFIASETFHRAFVVFALVYEVVWIVRFYNVLG